MVRKIALAIGFPIVLINMSALLAVGQTAVTTYHYDNNRTGWNRNESQLTPTQVASPSFGLLQNVAVDDQIDAQPLVMPGVQITAGNYQGLHDVVYVATESNSIYVIDVHSGTVLLNRNFGSPVGYPLGCNITGPNAGINSTPVIDPTSNTLYAMVYTSISGSPTYLLHALDLGSLSDRVTPQVVSASHTLSDGSIYNFNATYQRQRPALLLENGSIYAAFGSFCDGFGAYISRGWLLGWTAGSLAPFPSSELTDELATDVNGFFLSSIWMSGYGPAADDEGNVLFITGNSDPAGNTYNGVTNIQESVVKVSPTLNSMVDIFTPDNVSSMDQGDVDFGSGGVLVLPDQLGTIPHLAVAAGKFGTMYLMNEDNLGGYSPTTNNVLGQYPVGACWCGQSYYVDPTDGTARVVSSGGNTVEVWEVQTSPAVMLTPVTSAQIVASSVQDPGFFTTISSNGTASPIIWAVSRPPSNNGGAPIQLYAFNPDSGGSTMSTLYQATAGSWPNIGANANVVPVVANGLVFVGSYKQLQIFGLIGTGGATPTITRVTSSVNPSVLGKSVVFTATVSPQSGGGVPTGTVTFYDGVLALTTVSLSNGSAQYSTSALPAGSNSITAVYKGTSPYSGSTSTPLNQVVQVVTTTTATCSPSSAVAGQPVTFSASVSSSIGPPPDGDTVTFMHGASVVGTAILSGGVANLSTSLAKGSYAINAVYSGDAIFISSTSKAVKLLVGKASSTTSLISTLNPSTFGQSVTFTATVTPEFSGTPTGRVVFENGTVELAGVALSGGVASYTTTKLAAGTHSITAIYKGSTSFAASTSAPLSQVVNPASKGNALGSPANPSSDQPTLKVE
jgi:hypothetical protein